MNRYRLFTIGLGGVTLLWLSVEDSQVLIVTTLSLGWSIRLAGFLHPSLPVMWRPILLGILLGCAVAPIAVGLMFFKTAWHAHPYPDFPPLLLLAMLNRIPSWMLIGGLWGLAWDWYNLSRYRHE